MKNRVLFPISVENFKMKAEPTTLLSHPKHTHAHTQAHSDYWWQWESVGQTPRDSPGTGEAVKTMCSVISTGISLQNNPSKNHSAVSLSLLLREAVPSHDGHCYGTGFNKNIKNFRRIAGTPLLSGVVLMSPLDHAEIEENWVKPHYWLATSSLLVLVT